ncbi:putative hydrolase [Clostridium cavendishii DSM 21758]|uniref:Putative hydrolase n=1 Tax=Clostridium cavendishii DSM 21758 TaxID=1121302 RepID=A0A1M6I9S5_9CLOT|nr:phosphatase [Clostridium cavendishii]SHJ31244.1 putative hydrolase [Clostridium cavendishii DSM 21758]
MDSLIDLHCHTLASGHAYSTLDENIREASNKGLKVIGISDHGPNMPGGPHTFYFNNLRVLPKVIYGVKVLKGIEANIIDFDGNLDVDEYVLSNLDYAIASLHTPCIESGNKEECTNAVIKAMDIPKVKVIGHPDDSRFPLDYERLVAAAKKKGVLLEINNSSLKVDSYRAGARENLIQLLKLCEKQDVKVILSSDAHIHYEIADFKNCINLIEEVDFPKKLIANYNADILKALNLF